MKIISNSFLQKIKIIILASFLTLSVSYLYSFTGPTAPPPSNNTPAPINIGSTFQSKSGALALGTGASPTAGSVLDVVGNTSSKSLLVSGASILNGDVKIASGNPGTGKVLRSDASGNATWVSLTPVDTSLDPIQCEALGMAAASGVKVNFVFNNGVPLSSTPSSTSKCWYVTDSSKTAVDISGLVTSNIYVGVLKSINATSGLGSVVPAVVSGGISANGGHFYANNNGGLVNVSAIYVPTGAKFRQALNQ